MIKPLNFGNYQAMKRYSYNQMNAWAVSVYQSGFEDGQESMPRILEFDKDTMEEFLLKIDGIGGKDSQEDSKCLYRKRRSGMGDIVAWIG